MRWLDGITDSMNMNLGKLQEMVREGSLVFCSTPQAIVHGVTKSQTQFNNNNNNEVLGDRSEQ